MRKIIFIFLNCYLLFAANCEIKSEILSIKPLSIKGMVLKYIHSDKIVILQKDNDFYISDIYGKNQIKHIFTSSIPISRSDHSIISEDGLYFQIHSFLPGGKSISTVVNIETGEKFQFTDDNKHFGWFNIDSKNNLAYYQIREAFNHDKIFTVDLKTQESKYLCDGSLAWFALAPNKKHLISIGSLKPPENPFGYGIIRLKDSQSDAKNSNDNHGRYLGKDGSRIITNEGELTTVQFTFDSRESIERWSNTSRYISSRNKIIELNETEVGLNVVSKNIITTSLENHYVGFIAGNVFSPDDRYYLVYLTELDEYGHNYVDVQIGLVDIREGDFIAQPFFKIGKTFSSGISPVWLNDSEILIPDISNNILYLVTIE